MDISDENIQTLLAMGFPSEAEIRRALKLGKNDLSEAVAILTNESSSTTYDTLDDLDVEMKDIETRPCNQAPVYGPALPPSYDEVVEPQASPRPEEESKPGDGNDDSSLEFPYSNLYELEGRVFTESWSIPYKREESLGKCLLAATRLAEEGLYETDQYCTRFLERCMPESFQKLLTSGTVHRWGPEIQEGIYNMLQLLIDLVATTLQHKNVPIGLLHVLSMAFNPDTEYHTKNKARRPDRGYWEEKFGVGQTFAVSPPANSYKDPYGWLTNLINRFADKRGFDFIKERMAGADLDAPSMAALLSLFGQSAEFLNTPVVQSILSPGMEIAVRYVQKLDENELKDKKVGCVSEMLANMKLLCLHMWPKEVDNIDELRLEITLRMLKSPHFNARMNSLKEVTKLIEESSATKVGKTAINHARVLEWLVNNKVLSIALEGNIDQAQYCDKVNNVADFLGAKLSQDELTKIWKMQNGANNIVIDNIHSIIAAAAVKFSAQQLEQLFILVQKSWQVENDKMREKLISLIGKIGREAKIQKTTHRVLELLWDLAHLPALSTPLVEQALAEHLAILIDSNIVKEQIKKSYVVKCVDDIKEGKWVLPALKQLLQISKNIYRYSFQKAEKDYLQELNKSHDIIKLVTNSLVKFHQMAVSLSRSKAKDADAMVTVDTLVDGRYTHRDYVNVHLSFLQFVLEVGQMYLPWHRARDMWDCLAANPDACNWDRENCFEWFTKGISDLDQETRSQLFQKELLKLDSAKLSSNGFDCFKCFFENVNQSEHKLNRSGTVVEKLDLVGLDFLWEVCLNSMDPTIAEKATALLMTMCYTNLSPRLKRDPQTLHKKFIDECYSRVETAMIPLGGSALAQALSSATTVVTAAVIPDAAAMPAPSRSANLLTIERLLLIAERYVVTVEESHITARTILPHGASFQGHPLSLFVVCESPKTDFNVKAHTNETIGSVRQKIAVRLRTVADQVQIVANDKMLSSSKDQKLLAQLEFEDNQVLSVRAFSTGTTSSATSQLKEEGTSVTAKQTYDLEQEKMLPGVVMASGGHVFDMLFRLADLDEPKITGRARSLLKLIPTDPAISDALDALGQRMYSLQQLVTSGGVFSHVPLALKWCQASLEPEFPFSIPLRSIPRMIRQSSPDDISPRVSPRSSPRKLTPSPTPAAATSTSQNKAKPTPKEVLKNLFDMNAPDISTFRILYNLEVLSAKLMPTMRDPGTLQSANSFCDDFLNDGGLSLVVNVLQRDAIPGDTDYETRQGCYAICLQLLRFLLCGQEVTGESFPSVATRRASTSSLVGASGATITAAGSGPPSLEITPTTATRVVQTMGVSDFTDMVACFMRVSWAAAAGKLHLASLSQPMKENHSLFSQASSRSRQSSTGSTTSTGSEGDTQFLQAGVCVKQSNVSAKDANIAKEALELLVTCLQLRSQLLATFYSQPCVSDFIIDILVGSAHSEIRDCALDQFYLLSLTEVSPSECSGHQQTPHMFVLQTLLRARLPFWVSSSSTRGASHRLLKQCIQYFSLRCKLLNKLKLEDQQRLQVNVSSMLEDEINWLDNFVPSEHADMRETDNTLLAGHLRLVQTLLTCEGINKEEFSKQLLQDLLYSFLFPASRLMMDDTSSQEVANSMYNFNPKCSNSESRRAAYDVLVEMADGYLPIMTELSNELIKIHHSTTTENANEWEFMPPVDSRSVSGFVGLKNGGATCYMNSVIQQLYHVPGVTDAVLGIDDEEVIEDSVFYQIQNMFGHLLESKLQYYVPESFWKVFKLWGQTVNIREQQDALDFYQALIDQLDEQLKVIGKEEIFKKKFQGVFSDQKICKDCPHRYEREEVFFALNVTVKNANLQDSLAQYVKGELLEGDNAYFCEKCGEKRNTIKRLCIKTLPPLLCIQLKRFGYDWEANRALKFDDYFKFPWVLDMEPYTAEGMARREDAEPTKTVLEDTAVPSDQETTLTVCTTASNQLNYELVGVVVHSGQANAGHYYSFIKDRRGTHMTNANKGKWFKFNDTVIEEFDMNEAALEAECFGGTYKTKVYDTSSTSYPEERLRYWNGYLLFYEKTDEVHTPVSAKKSKMTLRKKSQGTPTSVKKRSDSLVELTELVHKGEKKGLFTDKMPARIQQVVRDENLRFMKNRDIYDIDYFRFIHRLADVNGVSKPTENVIQAQMCKQSSKLAVCFLVNTYLRTKKKLRADQTEWVASLERLLQNSSDSCTWMVEYFCGQGKTYIKPFLLECPTKEIRVDFAKVIERIMASFLQHGGIPTQKCFDELIEATLSLLAKDVADNIKNCTQYFWLLNMYSQMGTKACSHLFGRMAFMRLMDFLLGPKARSPADLEQEASQRRWSSVQARDFGPLHNTLAMLVLNCDVAPFRTEPADSFPPKLPTTVTPQIYLKMSAEMTKYVFGPEAYRYFREVVHAMREVQGSMSIITDMLLYCSFCNLPLTLTLLRHIMRQIDSAPSNELKGIFDFLLEFLMMEDPLQIRRLHFVIDGPEEGDYDGMLAVIKTNHMNDSRRSYQCIKFLVTLGHKCVRAKDYLIKATTKWQWAVNWLKKKMTEHYGQPQASPVLSNEDSNSRSFHRTMSAQDTLAEATALMREIDSFEPLEMEINSDTSGQGNGDEGIFLSPSTQEESLDEVDERL